MSAVSPIFAGLRCRCPRCGDGSLLKGFLTLRESCPSCGLDYGFADAGDGPAFFVMSIVGIIVVGIVLLVEVFLTPPLWVHMAYSMPLLLVLSLGLLRPFKGILIALQFHHKAEEGRLEGDQ